MEKKALYQLIISQLNDDGYPAVAQSLSDMTMIPPSTSIPTNRLEQLVKLGSSMVENNLGDTKMSDREDQYDLPMSGLNLTREGIKVNIPKFETCFVTTHKENCRTAKFSRDGKLCCTGSEDHSIKLLDVDKMKIFNQTTKDTGDKPSARPVVRTFYHHTERVNDIDFHPILPMFCSASDDKTIQLYDVRAQGKQSYKTFNETHNVKSVHFHPSGDFILAGTDHFMIRVYDVKSSKAFTSIRPQDHHKGPVNQVRYSADGSFYVSCSWDGSIRIWDTITNHCERLIANAHNGRNVCSIKISRSGQYILSGGTDSTVRLWDLGTGKQVSTYAKHTSTGDRFNVDFGYNEEFIVCVDEPSSSGVVYNTRSGEIEQKLSGHNNVVRWVAASPVEPAILTCSDDHRARFWCE